MARRLIVALLVSLALPAAAQEPVTGSILTIDQERLFAESEFGKTLAQREAAAAQVLAAENARIETGLIAEEQSLTDRRPTLSAEEFSALAAAFDEKVVRIRAEQDAKARELSRSSESDRQEFFRTVVPVLGDLLVERKAVAILDKSAIILSLTAIDVTDDAIAKVDATLQDSGEGSVDPAPDGTGQDEGAPVTPGPEAAPDAAPDAAPSP
jgi:Skp family chaperone for outer membrane proteins